MNMRAIATSFALALTLGIATAAQAVTVTFDRITSNSPTDAASQLSLTVTDDAANNRALFEFTAVSGAQNGLSIAEIYFSDILAIFAPPPELLFQSAGVSYEVGGTNNPGELPGANTASPAFVTTAGLVAEAAGNNATGINVGEILRLGLTYSTGNDFADFLAALNDEFRVGLHVRSLQDGNSDSFVSSGEPSPIPLPATGILLLGALGGMGLMRRRRKA